MSKFRGPTKWRTDGPVRTNTGSSIRGKISAPIIADDDEFPIRLPGTSIATPLGKESIASNGIGDSPPRASPPPPPQPAYEPPPVPTNQASTVRTSVASNGPVSNEGKPQRKKSSLGSVFRKIFGGKKRKDSSSSSTTTQGPGGFRAGQHRSVSSGSNTEY
jgi:hypothetical protein